MKFERYKRGQVVLVEFNPQVGAEIKDKHLAIVLNKKDSPGNGKLTVVPLTSKEKPYHVDLGNFLLKALSPFILESVEELAEHVTVDELEETSKSLKELRRVAFTYTKMNKRTYGMVTNITTVSKLRILKPMNKFDPIRRITVSSEILDKIDSAIIELYTGKN